MTQQQALDVLKLGHNAYITGPAGSGKTHLLNQYIDYLKQHDVDIGITASTGIAATHMGGVTIHSLTGLGVRDALTDYDIEALLEKPYLWKRMNKLKVLIIDEISMLHHFRLNLVERIIRAFKASNRPFGGIQVILCGDFFQLPPVSRAGEEAAHFTYHSEAWKNAGLKICYLEEQFRQTDDHMISILNDIRGNRVTETTMDRIKKAFKENRAGDDAVVPLTRLYTHNADVDEVNNVALDALPGEVRTYTMAAKGNDVLVSILKKSCLAPETLRLKKGATVMFVKNNFEQGYVNGTLGEVVSLKGEMDGPVVRVARTGKYIDVMPESWRIEEDGKVKAELNQFPLRLAWAITVHKSQGMSLDAVEVDLSRSFEKGMGYVALSRARTLAGLTINGLNEKALEVDSDVLEYDEELQEQSEKVIGSILIPLSKQELNAKQEAFINSISPLKPKSGGRGKKTSTQEETLALIREELPLKEIAEKRGMTEQTIIGHLEKLIEEDSETVKGMAYLKKSIPSRHFEAISEALLLMHEKFGDWRLAPAKDYLDRNKKKLRLSPAPTYRDIQLARIFVKADS